MPWCLARIVTVAGPVSATVSLRKFQKDGGLLLFEAFVSGAMKVVGSAHHDDARAACQAFIARWPRLASDIPAEPALNHAVTSAIAAGLTIDPSELKLSSVVVAASLLPEPRAVQTPIVPNLLASKLLDQ
jgi:hypothetical protein